MNNRLPGRITEGIVKAPTVIEYSPRIVQGSEYIIGVFRMCLGYLGKRELGTGNTSEYMFEELCRIH